MGEKVMKKLLTTAIISIALIGGSASAAGPVSYKDATTALNTLKVADEVRAGYKRTLFKHWTSAGNGCDSRKAVIISEAIKRPTVEKGCVIKGGEWLSIYDGVKVLEATKLDVDHFVPLAEAWDSGASAWTPEKREMYANDQTDPRHLIAVTGASNRSKSDRDPAEWMPTNKAYSCEYLVTWISVKVRWSLTVDKLEKDFLTSSLKPCKSTKFSVVPVK
jgi:hypothetical protein